MILKVRFSVFPVCQKKCLSAAIFDFLQHQGKTTVLFNITRQISNSTRFELHGLLQVDMVDCLPQILKKSFL